MVSIPHYYNESLSYQELTNTIKPGSSFICYYLIPLHVYRPLLHITEIDIPDDRNYPFYRYDKTPFF